MEIIIFYHPQSFSEPREQIAHYISSKWEKFATFITNIKTVDEIKVISAEIYANWLASGRPKESSWIAQLNEINKRAKKTKKSIKIRLELGCPSFSIRDDIIIIKFPDVLPKKYYLF